MPLNNLIGRRFGRLVVVNRAAPNDKQKRVRWACRCDCGNVITVRTDGLKTGSTASCGCAHRDYVARSLLVHGHNRCNGRTSEYYSWGSMNARCYQPSHSSYKYYGGRGIAVCEQWRTAFAVFYTDMGPKPTPKHSIDRINCNGNYEPVNCRWATTVEQRANRRA